MVGRILAAAGTAVAGAIVAGAALRKKAQQKKAARTDKVSAQPSGVLVCGATGAGKSSLINDILDGEYTRTGSGAEVTQGIVECTDGGISIRDTQGYTSGDFEVYLRWLTEVIEAAPPAEVWYCVNAGSKRFLGSDEECVRSLVELVGSERICIVLTKVDLVSEEELKNLRGVILRCVPWIPIVNYSVADRGSSFYCEYVEKRRSRLIDRARRASLEEAE